MRSPCHAGVELAEDPHVSAGAPHHQDHMWTPRPHNPRDQHPSNHRAPVQASTRPHNHPPHNQTTHLRGNQGPTTLPHPPTNTNSQVTTTPHRPPHQTKFRRTHQTTVRRTDSVTTTVTSAGARAPVAAAHGHYPLLARASPPTAVARVAARPARPAPPAPIPHPSLHSGESTTTVARTPHHNNQSPDPQAGAQSSLHFPHPLPRPGWGPDWHSRRHTGRPSHSRTHEVRRSFTEQSWSHFRY